MLFEVRSDQIDNEWIQGCVELKEIMIITQNLNNYLLRKRLIFYLQACSSR